MAFWHFRTVLGVLFFAFMAKRKEKRIRWSDEELLVAIKALVKVIKEHTGPDGWCYMTVAEMIAMANMYAGWKGGVGKVTDDVLKKLIKAGAVIKERVFLDPYEKYVYENFGGVIRYKAVMSNEQEILERYKSTRGTPGRNKRNKTPKPNKPGDTVFI